MRKVVFSLCIGLLLALPVAARAQDGREMVAMPPDIQRDMLISMRDHLIVLDTILSHLSMERYGEAAALAESRLRASPFDPAKEAAFAPYVTPDWKAADAALRQSATALAASIRKLDAERSFAASKAVAAATSTVTGVCVSCHARNRLR